MQQKQDNALKGTCTLIVLKSFLISGREWN